MRDLDFDSRNEAMIEAMKSDPAVLATSQEFIRSTYEHEYSYHFEWMGLPIIQYPQDIVAAQELIWTTRPQVIVETGIARGGSLVFYASMLQMIGGGQVIGIDIDIRAHNRDAIENHPMFQHIELIEGSSVDAATVERVQDAVGAAGPVMVVLDSNHTHDHVLEELRAYGPMVSPGCYLVVFDTIVEELPTEAFQDRPWGHQNSPLSAVDAYLGETADFEVDDTVSTKLGITAARGGYLRRSAG